MITHDPAERDRARVDVGHPCPVVLRGRPSRAWVRVGAAVGILGVALLGVGVLDDGPASSAAADTPVVLTPDPLVPDVPDSLRPLVLAPEGPVRDTVVVALHGYTSNPDQLRERLGADAWADELDATPVYPTGLGARPSWKAGACCGSAARSDVGDVAYLARQITQLRARGAERMVLVGYSNGGMLAYRFACQRPDLVDDVAVLNATITVASCEGAFDALHLAGASDTAVPVQGAAVVPYLFTGFRPLVDLPAAAPNATLDIRVLPGVGHEISPDAHGIITDWLLARG